MFTGSESRPAWILPAGDGRFAGVDIARTFASLTILIFHAIPFFFESSKDPILHEILVRTRFGVPILFLISGFALTHSLSESSYRPQQLGWHLLERLSRLYIPFAACHFLWLFAHWSGSRIITPDNQVFDPNWNQVLANLSWMPGFLGFDWCQYHFYVLPVFLGCYVLIGTTFPWLTTRNTIIRFSIIVSVSAWALLGKPGTLATCFPAFLAGVALYRSTKPVSRTAEWSLLLELAVLFLVIGSAWGPERAIGCGIGSLILLKSRRCPRVIKRLAGISYSIFLIHPLSIEIIGLQSRKWTSDSLWLKSGFFIFTLLCSVLLAACFHRCFEAPGLALAGKIKRFGRSATTQ